jgi:hypothetical protein
MRRWLAAAAVPLVAGCASAAGRPDPIAISRDVPRAEAPLPGIELRNANFELPPRSPNTCATRWDCSVHADPSSFTFTVIQEAPEGKQAICIERVGNEPWATLSQVVQPGSVRGSTLRLSMMMRVVGASGEGAGPWVVLQAGSGATLKHYQSLSKDTRGWTRATLEFDVLTGTELIEIGATLEGPGRACIDDVRLEVVKAARSGP